ncbi:hypothetical protein AMYX_11160 [Anaeromyxobacter diazotrophicus]|uniref:Glycosyltransferase subfamily 4-like N-terminal domain-containing protein n=2 Tax=Anaeromyxobacter diazotrophicus TaxID=2590199 RepID=A0A7I9VJ31_9BACT|nr:hypothetical protein AMYX_11160 [Anaeromyxobacter diazotrophicus]
MRIVQVSTLYPPEFFSGGTLAPHQVALTLKRRGHEVSVYSGSCVFGVPALTEKSWTYEGLPVHALTVTEGYGHVPANYRNASAAQRFDRYLAAVRPDVVHFHSIQALGADLLEVARRHGAAVVVTMHDGWWVCARQFMFTGPPANRMCQLVVDPATCDCIDGFDFVARRKYLASALESADRVLAVSDGFARVLVENGVAPGKVVTCENGVAPAKPIARRPSPRVRFGHFGGPDPWKGAATLARAMALLDSDVAAEVFGIEADAWRSMGGRWPDPRVHLRPRFGPRELPALMADLDVVVVTSIGMETFSIVAREAMQYGLPVITSTTLGPQGLVRDGENGLVYERGDAEGLAAAMRRFAEDPAFLASSSAAASATPIRTIEQQVDDIEAIYREVAANRDAPIDAPPLPRSVLFLAGMDGAPYRYRVMHLCEQLEPLGIRTTARFARDEEALALAGEHEIVVLNRVPWDPWVERVVARARAAGAVLVFGVDDLIFDPTLQIEALKALPRSTARAYRHGLKLFHETFKACDAFLGSTPALTEAASALGKPAFMHGNTLGRELVRLSEAARLAASEERARRANGVVRVGYFSGSYAHDADFMTAAAALAEVMRQRPSVRLVLGGHLRVPPVLQPFEERMERLPFVSWRELPGRIARIDINLAPLETPSRFNDAKSALKWFEAAAAGVPTIASPSAAFQEAIRHGETGMLAATSEEWSSALLALVDDAALRARIADAARTDALARFGPEVGTQALADTMRALYALAPGPMRRLPAVTDSELAAIRARGIGIGRPALEPFDAVAGTSQLLMENVTPPLGRITANQPVFLPTGLLYRVDFCVGTYGRIHRYDLVLRVIDLATGEELGQASLPAEHACDNSWLAFELDEIPVQEGRQVLFVIEAPAAPRREGLSLYCHIGGWPGGVGWAGGAHGFNLAYRTWLRPPGWRSAAAVEPATDPEQVARDARRAAARAARLEQRLAMTEERLRRIAAEPSGLARALLRTRPGRALARLATLAEEPGPSMPARVVRGAIAKLGRGDDQDVDRRMERVRATLAYRVGRRVYRGLRRR